MKKIKLILASLVAALTLTAGAVVADTAGVAHASISDCHVSVSGNSASSICYGTSPGGYQYQRIAVICRNAAGGATNYYGSWANVLQTSSRGCPWYAPTRIGQWINFK